MKLLTFQAKVFGWEPFSKTVPDAPDVQAGGEVSDAVVVFMHMDTNDESEERRSRVGLREKFCWLERRGTLGPGSTRMRTRTWAMGVSICVGPIQCPHLICVCSARSMILL